MRLLCRTVSGASSLTAGRTACNTRVQISWTIASDLTPKVINDLIVAPIAFIGFAVASVMGSTVLKFISGLLKQIVLNDRAV